jgi:cytoskeletal protein RodZ
LRPLPQVAFSEAGGLEKVVEKKVPSNSLSRWPDVAAIRQSKGITLDQISDKTKISKPFLTAIEAGEFSKLPGGIFNISYIRQYAREIDIGEADLLSYYYSQTGIPPADEHCHPQPPKKPVSRVARILTLRVSSRL